MWREVWNTPRSQIALNVMTARTARQPQSRSAGNPGCRLLGSLWRQPSAIAVSDHRTGLPWVSALHKIPSLLQPAWEAGGGRRQGGQAASAAAPAAALWLSWVCGVQRPRVLSTSFSPFQHHFRMVKWRGRRWPGLEGRPGGRKTSFHFDSQAVFTPADALLLVLGKLTQIIFL